MADAKKKFNVLYPKGEISLYIPQLNQFKDIIN